MKSGNDYLGKIVDWENSKWYVDNTDENCKDEDEETSLFLLPEEYADESKNDKLMRTGNPDAVGYWVHLSDVAYPPEKESIPSLDLQKDLCYN